MAYEGFFEILSKIPYYNFLASLIGEQFVGILIFTISLLIYGIVIWEFYHSLAKRDLFAIKIHPYMSRWEKLGEIITFVFKYTLAFPIYTFLWFLIFSLFLIVLSKSLQLHEIFVVSIAMISFTRAAAYWNEELAADVAKIVPLSLLGILIIDPTLLSSQLIINRLNEFMLSAPEILSFLFFTICLEWILRILYFIKLTIFKNSG